MLIGGMATITVSSLFNISLLKDGHFEVACSLPQLVISVRLI